MTQRFPSLLVLGGARSGKSSFAQSMAQASSRSVTMVATAEAIDPEMRERIEVHRRERPDHWSTIEEPLAIASALGSVAPDHMVILDCITVWLGNAMHHGRTPDSIMTEIDDLLAVVRTRTGGTVLVSNEVGLGIVPATELGRTYRDLLGRVNIQLAARVDKALLMVAGRALELVDVADIVS